MTDDNEELLALMERYLAAHARRGTAPHDETLERYRELRTRVLRHDIELARRTAA